jgi:hypothetical protein
LWSLIIDPTNLGLITEWDAVSSDGTVVVLALNPNGIGGQVAGLVSTNGISLGNPCNVPTGFGPSCGMTVYNQVAGQLVYVRKSINLSTGASSPPAPVSNTKATPGCGPNTIMASAALSGHPANPDSASPGVQVHDNNHGVVFTQQLVFPGPGPYETLLQITPFTNPLTQTLTFQCVGIVDSYADITLMRLVDDRGVEIATKRLDHTANGGTFSVNNFTISAQVTRNANEKVSVKFEANYGTYDARLSGSLLRDGTTLSIIGNSPCTPTGTTGTTPTGVAPTAAPKVTLHSPQPHLPITLYIATYHIAYTFIDINGNESVLSPAAYMSVTQPDQNALAGAGFDVLNIALPSGATKINYYIAGPYNLGNVINGRATYTPGGTVLPFYFSASGNGNPITIGLPLPGAKIAP